MPNPRRALLAASIFNALLLSTPALAADPASAQEPAQATSGADPGDEAKPRESRQLEAVTVTGSRVPRALSDLPLSITLVEEAEIAEQLSVSTNVLEALDVLVPGLTTSQEEARMGCNTNIRGRPAQFLINGVPTNDNLRRSSCRSLYSVSPFALERIEVLRGATALYGAGAPGGVINLLTRRARSSELETDFVAQWGVNPHHAGDSAETNLFAGLGQSFDRWDYYAGIGYQDYGVRRNPEGGILQGTTFQSWSFNTSVGMQVGEQGTLRFTGMHYVEDPRDFYGTDFTQVSGEKLAGSAFIAEPRNPYEDEAETTQTLLMLSYDQADVLGHTLNVSAYWHDEVLIQRAADFFAGEVFTFDSDAENQRQGLRIALDRAVDGDGLGISYGVDVLEQRYYRPVVDPATGEIVNFVSPEVLLDSVALFAQPQYRAGSWLFTGGVRREFFEGEVGDAGYDPGIPNASTPGKTPDFALTLVNLGVVYDLSSKVQLFGGFSQGAEISEFGRAARGADDPATINLDAATSDQFEIGIRGRHGALDFSAAAFRSQSDKAASLQADPSCAGQPLCPLIPLRLEQSIRGLELMGGWQAGERTRIGGLLTYQRGEFGEPGAPRIDFGSDTLAPLRTTAYVEFEPVAGWKNRLQATYQAATDLYDAGDEAMGFRDTGSVFLVDWSSSVAVGPGVLSLGVSNLFNRKYVNATNQASGDFFYYLSEGTRATLGYSLRF